MIEATGAEFGAQYLSASAEYIQSQVPFVPKVLIICGSGLGSLADTIKEPIIIPYEEIPNFPRSTVPGHAGKLVFGVLSGAKVVCMQGRFHYYEGYSLQKVTTPIRIMKMIGVKFLIVTNAAGGVNPDYKAGDLMIIKDHFNFLGLGGNNPLRGPNDETFGERFFPVNRAYERKIIDIAKEIAKQVGIEKVHEGVYAMVGGPNYESIAEINALKQLGVDAVGMSTIPEVLVAKHCGLIVFGFSLITNECVHSYDDEKEPNHQEVLEAVNKMSHLLQNFVIELCSHFVCKKYQNQ